MNAMSIILLVGGAIIAVKAFGKATAAKTLNFYPAAVKKIEFDGITPVITLGMAIQNPSNSQFVIRGFVGNLYANGILIGNVSAYGQTVIAPTSQTVYSLAIRLSLLGIVNDIIKSFNGESTFQQTIELNAWANVDNYSVPIKLIYKLP